MKTLLHVINSHLFTFCLICSIAAGGLLIGCRPTDPAPQLPIASFHLASNNCTAPCDPGIINLSKNAQSYRWDFGDGGSSIDGTPLHTYTKAGSFPLKLTVKGEQDLLADTTVTVTIKNPEPVPAFLIQNDNCIAPCTVVLQNQSTNSTTYSWKIITSYVAAKAGQICPTGSNCPVYRTTTEQSPSQTYSITAPLQGLTTRLPYTVELTATGPGGTQTITKNITIR